MDSRKRECNKIDSLIKSLQVNRYMKVLREKYQFIDIHTWKQRFKPLVALLNTCILSYNQVKPFFIENPLNKEDILKLYEELGLNQKFLSFLLYRSGRPRTDMRDFLSYLDIKPIYTTPKGYQLSHREDDFYYVCNEEDGFYENVYCNVIRYQVGMSGYLLVNQYNTDYCGTFYYFEPDSEVSLQAATCLVTWNKITAALELGMDREEVDVLFYDGIEEKNITPRLAGYGVDTWEEVVDLYLNHELNPMVHYYNMYATEDSFDQPLCLLAKEKGIDIIVLKYMTGGTRVVSEVIDTRSRIMSFENLTFNL